VAEDSEEGELLLSRSENKRGKKEKRKKTGVYRRGQNREERYSVGLVGWDS